MFGTTLAARVAGAVGNTIATAGRTGNLPVQQPGSAPVVTSAVKPFPWKTVAIVGVCGVAAYFIWKQVRR